MKVANGMQASVGMRRGVDLRRGVVVSLLLALPASGQIAAPRYQSPAPVEAPLPQLALPVPPSITPNAAVVEDVIVRVNDQIIDRSDVERNSQQMAEAVQQGKMTQAEFASAQRDMLRDMIDEQLLLSRAKETDLNVDTEVVRQLDEIRKQNKLDSMEDLEKAVRQSGISYEDFKADMKNRLLRQLVVRDEVGRTLRRPSIKEEQAFYDAHQQEFQQPEQVRLSEILIPTPDNPTDAQVAQAQKKAEEVAGKLKAGAKFEDMAKQNSSGQTAGKGGDLGLWKRGALAKVLEDQTFPLQAGESTAPIRTRQGFVVLKVTEHQAAGVPPLKDVEEQIQEGLYSEQMQPALRKFLTDRREKAYIDIAPGFVDTGASVKETKPVYSAYTPPAPKKKSTVQKQRLAPTTRAAGAGPGGTGAAASAATSPATTGSTASAANVAPAPPARIVNIATGKKPRKIRREKVRFGQAPRNSLPSAPEETLAAGADQGIGATPNTLPAPGAALAPTSPTNTLASNVDVLGPPAPPAHKTRYSDRAPTEAATKAATKAADQTAKVKQAALKAPPTLTAEQKAAQQTQTAPLGLSGDTASKKKKTKVKGGPKERLQDQAPAPPAAKPEATPIPPRSVRDKGEPLVSPSPDSTPAPASSPAPGATSVPSTASPIDTPGAGTLQPGAPGPAPQPNQPR